MNTLIIIDTFEPYYDPRPAPTKQPVEQGKRIAIRRAARQALDAQRRRLREDRAKKPKA